MKDNFYPDSYREQNRNLQHDLIMVGIIILTCIGSFFCGCEFNKNTIHSNAQNGDTLSHSKAVVLNYDSAIKEVARPYPVVRIDSFKTAGLASIVDTAAIIQQYFTGYVFNDSIRTNDLFLSITDTLERNKITGRFIAYKILRPDSIIKEITTLKAPEISHLYTGIIGGTQTFAPAIIYNRKNKYLVGLSSNILLPQPSFQASLYFKIW